MISPTDGIRGARPLGEKGIDARAEPNQESGMAKGNNSHKKETKKPKKEKPKVVATRRTT